jgi:hypothetical protein
MVQDYVDAPDEKNNTPRQQGKFICIFITVVVHRMSGGGMSVLSLHGIFESNRQGNGDAS